MRLIGSLKDQQQAEFFSAYLLTQGIQSHLEEDQGDLEIWIKDEDKVQQAVSELAEFQANSDDPKYQQSVPKARQLQREQVEKQQRMAKNLVTVSGGKLPINRQLTLSMVAICAVVALFTGFGNIESRSSSTFRALSFNAFTKSEGETILAATNNNPDSLQFCMASFAKGEVWRLITPIFIHFGALHIVFNMYWLVILGSQIENRYGALWYALLILGTAIFSNVVQCAVPLESASKPVSMGIYYVNAFGGMSGVNYGLFGFILMRMMYVPSSNLSVSQGTTLLLLGWLVFCMVPGSEKLIGVSVANWAHVAGFLFGVIAGYWPMLFSSDSGSGR